MCQQEKKSRNEKLKALREFATLDLNQMVDQTLENTSQAAWMKHLVRIQNTLIDLLETMIEPEEPE